MVTVRQGFSAVTEAFTTVSDRWPAVILSAVSDLHIMVKDFIYCTKNKVFIQDFFSKFDQIDRKLRIWSHLLKKSLMENFIFCAVIYATF